MFRDLKEYQQLQKLYEAVSNAEIKKEKNKKLIANNDNKNNKNDNNKNDNKVTGTGPVVDNPNTEDKDERVEYGKKLDQIKANKKREQDKKTDTSSEIESDANYAKSNKNMNKINKFGKSSVPKLVKSPMEAGMGDGADKARAIAKARIKSGKTIADVKAANTQSMKDRARARNDAFKAKRAERNLDKQRDFDDPAKGNFGLSNDRGKSVKKLGKKQPKVLSPMDMRGESYEPYDVVLEYLLSTQQAATIEEANYIMTEMDAKTIQDIVSQQQITEKNFIQKFINPDKKKFGNQDKPLPIYMRKGRQRNGMPL